MTDRYRRTARVLLALALTLAAAAPAAAQSKRPAGKSAQAQPAAPLKLSVAVESVLDRRTTRDFPRSALTLAFKLEGADAAAVQSARASVAKATDDTGASLLQKESEKMQGVERWEEAREGSPPTPKVEAKSVPPSLISTWSPK